MDQSTSAPADVAAPAARGPIDHTALSPGCPVMHHGAGSLSKADMIAHAVLRIPAQPAEVSNAQVYSTFQRSMLVSAVRCLLTYIVLPFVLPAVGFAKGVGPIVGIAIGVVALTFNVFTIRRFHIAGHKWRWHYTAIVAAVMVLLLVLMVQDIIHLVT
jgi:hypothetical protein